MRAAASQPKIELLLVAPAVLMLPSALATSEITPSNLRLVGIIPFLALLVGYGTVTVLDHVPPAPMRFYFALALFIIPSAPVTFLAYQQWATSSALFFANDGEMALAARALDQTDLTHTTVYIASLHYRHPTVAALAEHFGQAKWLTGGATLVLPARGDALYMVPATLPPPSPWPYEVDRRWKVDVLRAPDGSPALYLYRLSADDIAALRPRDATSAADFAHVALVYGAQPLDTCRAAQACPVLVTWQVRAPYPSLQAAVRLMHPVSGQWDRVNPFHYPTAEWTAGDVVLDQFTLTPPAGTPPVDGYQVGVSFFNPDTKEILPRLKDEQFDGLEARFPLGRIDRADADTPPTPSQPGNPCASLPQAELAWPNGLRLRASQPPGTVRAGEKLDMTLCWHAPPTSLTDQPVHLGLVGNGKVVSLYDGAPVQGQYPFGDWQPGERVVDRFSVRLPRDTPAADYTLLLGVGKAASYSLGKVTVPESVRTFATPAPQHPVAAQFGQSAELLGYDAGAAQAGQPLRLVLFWKTLSEMDTDYTVFVHVTERATGRVVAQVDEQPVHGGYPTSLWVRGEVVADEHTLNLPALPAGEYDLRVGLYVQDTGERLTVNGDTGFIFGTITVNA